MENSKFIPYGRQDITEEDIEEVVKVLHSDFLTQGPAVPLFEQKLCSYTGARYSVAVNSCTSALHIACLALGLVPGDILWTSPITFVASANCALYCGASVDFVDIEPDTALMSVEKLSVKLELAKERGVLPKIVIPVHFSGQSCDMKEIYALSRQYGFKIIEDAAHAIGASYQNELVGNCRYSDITVFSFHPVKIITTGEGGVAMTNSSQLAEKMKLLRSHGITKDLNKIHEKSNDHWYYEQVELGFNYRMTDIQAALGISQLNRLDQYVLRRTEIVEWYDERFKDVAVDPLIKKSSRTSAHHLYIVRVKKGSQLRDKLYRSLIDNGIGANVHYIPVYQQFFFKELFGDKKCSLAEEYYAKTITLPLNHVINDSELEFIVNKVIDIVK